MELTVDVDNSPVTLEVPMPDGSIEVFHVVESPVMEQPLADRYPLIKTYAGQSLNGKLNARFDMGYQGFHAIVNTPKGAVYVDPVEGANDRYISYYAHEYQEHFMERESDYRCHMDHEVTGDEMPPALTAGKGSRDSGPILRTYALAVACTGEYSNAHGGTKPSVLSAITTIINRINEVYIREFAVRMNLIANNDALIFLNPGTDPYDNVNSGVMLQQNTGVINGIVGSGAYDFGHVFATGTSGGVAFLGSVCTGNKGAGVSGSTNTNGDPFAIDLVAHEIGHQFASPHTFNGTSGNCNSSNRSSATAWEPGSGTTIMAYAGICAPQNVQSFHDPYFHAGAHDRIMAFVSNSNGSVCATNTTTGNSIPEVDASASDGFTIPISTPFQLWGAGTDPDGEELDFMWEQMDLGPPGHPNFPTGNAPLFRSFRPDEEPTRIFPRLLNIVIGNQVLGEILPDYSRNMRFRLTARDNNLVSGGVGSDEISVAVSNAAGPFEVIAPSNGQVVGSGTVAMVTWDVANTDQAPVNSQWVNISLSIDNGFTYPDTLTLRTANDGSELVQFPNVSSTAARVRVQADDNLFFNISPSNFTISPVGVGIVAPINLTLDPDFQSTVTLDWTD
ncbi:MAG: reprolysin-like metallopeptidase, partial [Bacteroidota bacterium]